MSVHFCILGPLRVVLDDRELALGRRQQRALLARLLVEPRRAVSTDRLVEDLWGQDAPPSVRTSLQALVSRLRTVLEPDRGSGEATLLIRRPPGYALDAPPGAIDAERFAELAEAGRQLLDAGQPGAALEQLDAALALWRGEVLADLADDAFVVPVAVRLEALRTDVRERRAAALLGTGAAASAIADLEALTADAALRQRPWELLLLALHAAGRTAEALERYRDLRDRFRDELGLDPGPGLQRVEAALLRGAPVQAAGSQDPTTPGGASPAPPAPPRATVDAGRAPIGRTEEWETLTTALERGSGGSTTWAAVIGEAGMGKTTLVQQLTLTGAARGASVLVGRCHEADVTPAFWPWVQVLRGLEPLAPGAATLLDRADREPGDTTGRRFVLFDRVATTLRAAAEHRPLLLVLEDVHWADVESLELIDFLAVQLRDVPLTIVVTARRDEGPEELRRTLAELARQAGQVRLDLAGLDTAATGALVSAVTGEPVEPTLAERLRGRTGGNPFFTSELARLGGPALAGDVLPDTIREILTRRIDRLPAAAADLLTLAAVLGGEFGLDALTACSEDDDASVLDHLDLALDARLVVATDDPLRFRFAHALVRDAALDRLSDLQRRRTSLAIAASLQQLAPSDPTVWAAEVARHLLAAAPLGDPRETLDAACAAARIAQERLAFHEAAHWWTGALRVLDWDRARGSDQRLRFDLLRELGGTLGDAGDWAGAIGRLAEAIDVAEALDDPAAMADAATAFERTSGLWPWIEYGTRPVELLRRLDRVIAALEEPFPERHVEVLAIRAAGEYYGDRALGLALAEQALRRARELRSPQLVLTGLLATLRISYSHDDLDGQLARSAEMVELATAVDAPYAELLAWSYRVANLTMVGDLAAAEEAFATATGLARRQGLVIVQAQLGWTASLFPMARGDLRTAERLVEEANDFHARTGLYARLEAYAWARAVLLWDEGRLDELDEASLVRVPEARAMRRHLAGDRAGARELLARRCAAATRDAAYDHVGFLQLRARVAVAIDAADLADDLITRLAPHVERIGVCGTISCVGPVAIELAQLRALAGDVDAAASLLDATIERATAAGWTLWTRRAERARERLGDVVSSAVTR